MTGLEHNLGSEKRNQPLRFIDIAAGVGGLALGLEDAGFTPVLLVEPDGDSRASICANRDWPVASTMDVATMDALAAGRVDLLAGSLSSVGITIAGRARSGSSGNQFQEALSLVAGLRPNAMLLVNVPGLMHQRFASLREDIGSQLHDNGYQYNWRVIDSAAYGLPQSRRRSILIAFQSSAFSNFRWPPEASRPPTVGEALAPYMLERGWPGAPSWINLARGIAPTIVGGSKRHGGADLGPSRTKEIWYSLGVDGRGIADEAPGEDASARLMPRLTNDMLAALQGFPSAWKFVGKKTSVFRQVAGAFPPPTAAAIGKEIRVALER